MLDSICDHYPPTRQVCRHYVLLSIIMITFVMLYRQLLMVSVQWQQSVAKTSYMYLKVYKNTYSL